MRVKLPIDDLVAWLPEEIRARAATQARFQQTGTLPHADLADAAASAREARVASRRPAELQAFLEIANQVRLRAGAPPELDHLFRPAESELRRRHGDALFDEVLRRREEIAAAYAPLEALMHDDDDEDA